MDDGGLGVVRIKPLGVGMSDQGALQASKDVEFCSQSSRLVVDGRQFTYPSHVIAPTMNNQEMYDAFMPNRVEAFLQGINVNIMAYGQTGSGKTHTMFGPPGIMARAAAREFGDEVCPDYGMFPRGLIAIFEAVELMRQSGEAAVLTASAVELANDGNRDMLCPSQVVRDPKEKKVWDSAQLGVALDRSSEPPRLYGMTELTLDGRESLIPVFAGIATRNTAATKMNDASSRSHCFVYLTLRVYDSTADAIRTSRFQFCDLAGSERLEEAHGEACNPFKDGGEVMNGFGTNFTLMMLSSCARQLVEARRKRKMKSFSFRTFLVDLVMLLKESMTGTASTACFVCLSQAPANLSQSKYALDFGEVFANLSMRPEARPREPRKKLVRATRELLQEAEKVAVAAIESLDGPNPEHHTLLAQMTRFGDRPAQPYFQRGRFNA
ncbi:hypothetical protein CYMTET_54874 [Cymbomonas tetramitiformis]|uniref:Kinesin-like protein n=1 Tax=Cymbomonas tetramitiformis TaxID=36881 RepID=A0AAE0BE27_9CHLO|nr:hypothetical protein CYMTET_54874 [Cymbomonas tetramitiformis]